MNFKMDFYVQVLKIPIGMICYDFCPVMCMFNLTENCRVLEYLAVWFSVCSADFSHVKTESVRVMMSRKKEKKIEFFRSQKLQCWTED